METRGLMRLMEPQPEGAYTAGPAAQGPGRGPAEGPAAAY